jgi:hypothetical protein
MFRSGTTLIYCLNTRGTTGRPPPEPPIPCFGPVPGVSQLSFERAHGVICARDGQGKLVMNIPTGPGFGERLAAAFYEYRNGAQEAAVLTPLSNESSV